MIKSLARAVSLGSLLCAPLAGAYQFGEHAAGTVDKLIHCYAGPGCGWRRGCCR